LPGIYLRILFDSFPSTMIPKLASKVLSNTTSRTLSRCYATKAMNIPVELISGENKG
jgi:hypothetical protein